MAKKSSRGKSRTGRRVYSDELKTEAVHMLLDGHSAESMEQVLSHLDFQPTVRHPAAAEPFP